MDRQKGKSHAGGGKKRPGGEFENNEWMKGKTSSSFYAGGEGIGRWVQSSRKIMIREETDQPALPGERKSQEETDSGKSSATGGTEKVTRQ